MAASMDNYWAERLAASLVVSTAHRMVDSKAVWKDEQKVGSMDFLLAECLDAKMAAMKVVRLADLMDTSRAVMMAVKWASSLSGSKRAAPMAGKSALRTVAQTVDLRVARTVSLTADQMVCC